MDVVLNYLEQLIPLEKLTLSELTEKLVMLLALSTAQISQTLAKIKLSNIKETPVGIEIIITDNLKTSRPGSQNPMLKLSKFNDRPGLCVVSCLDRYKELTSLIRKEEDHLFIAIKKPHSAVGSQTISRWIKNVLHKAGINTEIFSSHSTRHASTSAAHSKGLDWETIRKTAGWSKESTVFAKFYNKPIENESNNFMNFLFKK